MSILLYNSLEGDILLDNNRDFYYTGSNPNPHEPDDERPDPREGLVPIEINHHPVGYRIGKPDLGSYDNGIDHLSLFVPKADGSADRFEYYLDTNYNFFSTIKVNEQQHLIGIPLTDMVYKTSWFNEAPEHIKRYIFANSNGHICTGYGYGMSEKYENNNLILLLHSLPAVDFFCDNDNRVDVFVDYFTSGYSARPSNIFNIYPRGGFGSVEATVPVHAMVELNTNTPGFGCVVSDLYTGKVLSVINFKQGARLKRRAYQLMGEHSMYYRPFRISMVSSTENIFEPAICMDRYVREYPENRHRIFFSITQVWIVLDNVKKILVCSARRNKIIVTIDSDTIKQHVSYDTSTSKKRIIFDIPYETAYPIDSEVITIVLVTDPVKYSCYVGNITNGANNRLSRLNDTAMKRLGIPVNDGKNHYYAVGYAMNLIL